VSTQAPDQRAQEPPDLAAFARDVDALRARLEAGLGPSDLAHFQKMERWGRVATGLGYATAWLGPNPVSVALLALGSTARWTIVAHHVSHRGLDRVPGAPSRYKSKLFARGLRRRVVDWLDWVDPEAWDYEHNVLHHYRVGERADPDLVEHHMDAVRTARLPDAVKLGIVAFYATTWRLVYYAPNTFQVLREARRAKANGGAGAPAEDVDEVETRIFRSFDPRTAEGRAFYASIAPYALVRFGLAPLAFSALGPAAGVSVLVNTALAEVVSNVHTFCLIAPNHAGDDLYRFSERPVGRGELYARQVLGSADFTGGSDVADFLQGFLNYQIEHHLFPDLPPSKLREAQPAVRALCAKHGIPYVREPLRQRVRQLLDIMVGRRSMKRAATAAEATGARPRG
jgi:fatty acid desaturase